MINSQVSDKNKRTERVLFIFSFLLFSYTTIRAYLLTITWDEAFSYLEFTRYGILFPIHVNGMSANNHLLNTWLTYITTSCFGNREFSLRIPNLLSHLMFLFFTVKISNEFSSKLLTVSAFLILNLNPYLLDFFSLSRGYGLSYGLLAGSLWHLYLFVKNNFQNKYSILSLLFAMLAAFAHLTLLYFVLSVFGIIMVLKYIYREQSAAKNIFTKAWSILKNNFVVIIMLLAFLSIVIPLGIALQIAGALFYGGHIGFWTDTIQSSFDRFLYEKSYSGFLTPVLSILFVLFYSISFLYSIKILKNKNRSTNKIYFVLLFTLLSVCSFATIFQHFLFDTLYLTERTTLFLWILFSFMFVFLLNEWIEIKNRVRYLPPFIAGIIALHFTNCFNFYYVLEWKYDADVKTMLSDIELLQKNNNSKFNFSLGTTLELEQPVNYYRFVNNLTWLDEARRTKNFNQPFDASIVLDMDYKKLDAASFIVLKNYPFLNNKLIKYKFNSSK